MTPEGPGREMGSARAELGSSCPELGRMAEGSQDQNSEMEWEAHRGNHLESPPTYL